MVPKWYHYAMARLPDPDPNTLHPVPGQPRVVLLRPLIRSPLIEVGEFTYYDDPDQAEDFQRRNVLHLYGPDRLVIGRFCALAAGVTFIMNGANHRMDGVSTFPFPIMGGSWAEHLELITLLLLQDVLAEQEWANLLTDHDRRGLTPCSGNTSFPTARSSST